jgi:hypothetical protein
VLSQTEGEVPARTQVHGRTNHCGSARADAGANTADLARKYRGRHRRRLRRTFQAAVSQIGCRLARRGRAEPTGRAQSWSRPARAQGGEAGDGLYAVHVEYARMSLYIPRNSRKEYIYYNIHYILLLLHYLLIQIEWAQIGGFRCMKGPTHTPPYVGHLSNGFATRTKVPSGCRCSWPIWISWVIISCTSAALSRQRICCWKVRTVAGSPVRFRART